MRVKAACQSYIKGRKKNNIKVKILLGTHKQNSIYLLKHPKHPNKQQKQKKIL